MLIGPKAAWSQAFLLLSTTRTLQVMEMTRILLSIISVCYLGTKYRCATWLCCTAVRRARRWWTQAVSKGGIKVPNISIKGPKYRVRCLQDRPILLHAVFEKLKGFNARHCVTSTTSRLRSSTFLFWSASCQSCWHAVWGWTRWGPVWESNTQLRGVVYVHCSIITVKPTKAFTTTKAKKN